MGKEIIVTLKQIFIMPKLPRVKVIRNAKGKPTKLLIDIKRYEHLVEDILDTIAIEETSKEPTIPAEEVYAKIEKKWKR